MAQITIQGAAHHEDTYNILLSILADLTALKVSQDASKTAIDELIADHATFKIVVDELVADHATFKTVADDTKALANDLRNKLLGDFVDGETDLAIGSDKPKVAYIAFEYHINGEEYSKGASTTGVALSGDTVPDTKAGAWALEINAAGTVSIVPASANGTGYVDKAAAIAALPAQTADKARLGVVAVLMSGGTFVPGTTDLDDVTVASSQFVDATPLLTTIGAAISTSAPATLSGAAPASLSASAPTAVGTLTTTS